ncbi:MAG: hypothetical protein DRP46_13295 [Candidatus Zixiibacteriota bacterium]|nr:MAG: hypothetical protein DRP46_13295 [candidate division Zixibacteria bacterium]
MNKFREHRTYFEEPFIRTPFFKALTPGRNLSETRSLEKLCDFSKDDLILDHGCGQGRHCTQLTADGYTAIGFDYSKTLLDLAVREKNTRGLDIFYIRGDMLYLPIKDSLFDWALSLFGSFGYLSDQENIEVLQEIRRILKPGGKLILDIWNKDAILKKYGDDKKHEVGKDQYFIQKRRFDHNLSRMHVDRFFIGPDNEEKYSVSFRVYTRDEISKILSDLKFEILDFRGSFTSRKITPDSRSMVIVAGKSD